MIITNENGRSAEQLRAERHESVRKLAAAARVSTQIARVTLATIPAVTP